MNNYFSRITNNKEIILIFLISLFLRFYKLSSLMVFIPDAGWFYLSARDILITGNLPLIGPPTSHPWIHHGAFWTYLLAVLLKIGNFNPVFPAYYIAVLGSLTLVLYYLIIKEMFSKNIAILSTILFSSSPLIVLNSRIPYHTSPIPFFTILLFYSVYKWTKGVKWYFPIIMMLLAVLYNHEITTFVFSISVFFILFFGLIFKRKWVKILNFKVIFISLIAFLLPMLPFIIYDLKSGYKQTFGFLAWVGYRVVKTPLSFMDNQYISSGSNPSTLKDFFTYVSQLFYPASTVINIILIFITVIYIVKILYQNIQFTNKKIILNIIPANATILVFVFLVVSLVGLFIHRVPIEADTLLISPFLIILLVLGISNLFQKKPYLIIITVLFISVGNIAFLINTNFLTEYKNNKKITLKDQEFAIEKIISLSNGKNYNIKGRGELSNFPVFTMPYEYILWWKGFPIDKKSKNTIIIWESNNTITVYKE